MKPAWVTILLGIVPLGQSSDRIGRSVPTRRHARRRWLFRLVAVLLLLLAGFAFGWAVETLL